MRLFDTFGGGGDGPPSRALRAVCTSFRMREAAPLNGLTARK